MATIGSKITPRMGQPMKYAVSYRHQVIGYKLEKKKETDNSNSALKIIKKFKYKDSIRITSK